MPFEFLSILGSRVVQVRISEAPGAQLCNINTVTARLVPGFWFYHGCSPPAGRNLWHPSLEIRVVLSGALENWQLSGPSMKWRPSCGRNRLHDFVRGLAMKPFGTTGAVLWWTETPLAELGDYP